MHTSEQSDLQRKEVMKSLAFVVALACLMLAAGCATPAHPSASAWEYTMAGDKDDAALKKTLNSLGRDGWELVSVYSEENGWHQAVLKRAKTP
jgi:hypothetical protein